MNKDLKFETHCVRTQAKRSSHKEHSVPIFETSSYIFNSAEEARAVFAEEEEGNIYTRFSNPNTDEFIQKLCALEGAEDGIATASGMAAVYLSLNALLRPGDHVLASRQLVWNHPPPVYAGFVQMGRISHLCGYEESAGMEG